MEKIRCIRCKRLKTLKKFDVYAPTGKPATHECKLCRRRRNANNKKTEAGMLSSAKTMSNWRAKNPNKYMWSQAKIRAKTKGVPFTIQMSDIQIPETCPALGIRLFMGKDRPIANSPSLDRIIPEMGYVPGNIAVISQRANRIKADATLEEIERVVEWLREKSKSVVLSATK